MTNRLLSDNSSWVTITLGGAEDLVSIYNIYNIYAIFTQYLQYLHNIYTIYILHAGCPISQFFAVFFTEAHLKCQSWGCLNKHCVDMVAKVPIPE